MDDLRSLLGMRRAKRVMSVRVEDLSGMKKEVDERIGENVFWCFSHTERMENSRGAQRSCEGECKGR